MQMNKQAINRSYEMRGFQSTMDYGAEMFALVLMSESQEVARVLRGRGEAGPQGRLQVARCALCLKGLAMRILAALCICATLCFATSGASA